MSAHMPGHYTFDCLRSDEGRVYRVLASNGCPLANLECCADDKDNARLFAAAPQMLLALRAAHDALRSYQYGNDAPALAEEIADLCGKAIAVATGEQV